jgi:ABC-type lipoprotein export system ATPase subunit
MIRLENVTKYYKSNDLIAVGIRKINLNFKIGEFIAITGESGSGKSTLLNILSGLDTFEEGEFFLNGEKPHIIPSVIGKHIEVPMLVLFFKIIISSIHTLFFKMF